jgi:Na+/proline symporter
VNATTNRVNGTVLPIVPAPSTAPKPKGKKPTRKPAAPKPAPRAKEDHLIRYAYTGVAVMSLLSAGLNGYANSLHATIPWAGWGMGVVIPAIILILGKVGGLLWKRGHHHLAYLTAGSGVGLLVLSVWHCATSISLLTGSPLILAMPMAIAIDAGFVCCELAALVAE